MASEVEVLTLEVRRLTARLNDTINLLYNLEKRIDRNLARRLNQNRSAPQSGKISIQRNRTNVGETP